MLDPTKPIKATSAPAPAAGVKTLSAPNTAALPKAGGGLAQGGAWKAALPKPLNDSVADKVKELTSQDSALMQQAKTEGLKIANRRGLLNSSMAIGAAQDAMVSKALPIASQDASQSFQKNMQARDFEFRMEGQDDDQAFQSGERALDRGLQRDLTLAEIASTEGMAAAQRALDERMQQATISLQDRQQLRDIASREGLAAADRALQQIMQTADIASREGLAAQERALQERMQSAQISAADRQQVRDIASREGLAAAERALQEKMQVREIDYQKAERGLDRALQEKLASWNLKSADRNAAAQLLTNMESMYGNAYEAIMANPNLDASTRTAQLASIKNLRDRQLNFTEQLYVVDLKWTDADYKAGAAQGTPALPTTPTTTPTKFTAANFPYARYHAQFGRATGINNYDAEAGEKAKIYQHYLSSGGNWMPS